MLLSEVANKLDLPHTIVVEKGKNIFIPIFGKELSSIHNVMQFPNVSILAPQITYCDKINSKVINFMHACQNHYECKLSNNLKRK